MEEQPTHVRLEKWARHLGFKGAIDANNLQEVCQIENKIWEDVMRKICPNVNHIRQNILLKKLNEKQLQGVTHVNGRKDKQYKYKAKLEKRLNEIEENIQDEEKKYDDLQRKLKCNIGIQHKRIVLAEMALKVDLLQEKENSVKRKINDLKHFLETTQHYIEPKLKLDRSTIGDPHTALLDCHENYMQIDKVHGGDAAHSNSEEKAACPIFLEQRLSGFSIETVWKIITDLQEKLLDDVEASPKSAQVSKYCSLQLSTSPVNDLNVYLINTCVMALDCRRKKAQKLDEYICEKERCKEAYEGYLHRNPLITGQPPEPDKFLDLVEAGMRGSFDAIVLQEIERLNAETEALGDPMAKVLVLEQQKEQLLQDSIDCETVVVQHLNARHRWRSNLMRIETEVMHLLEPMVLPDRDVVEKLRGSLMKEVQQLLDCPLKALSETHLSSGRIVPTYQMLTEYGDALVCEGLSPRALGGGPYSSPEILLMTTISNKLYLNQLQQLKCETLSVPSLDMVAYSEEISPSTSLLKAMLDKLENRIGMAKDLVQFWWNQPLQNNVRESMLVSGKNLKAYQDLYDKKVSNEASLSMIVHSVPGSSCIS